MTGCAHLHDVPLPATQQGAGCRGAQQHSGDGSVIRAGCRINHSVIGLRTLISEGCTIDDALIMGSDYYETMDECALVPGCLPMGLGESPGY